MKGKLYRKCLKRELAKVKQDRVNARTPEQLAAIERGREKRQAKALEKNKQRAKSKPRRELTPAQIEGRQLKFQRKKARRAERKQAPAAA